MAFILLPLSYDTTVWGLHGFLLRIMFLLFTKAQVYTKGSKSLSGATLTVVSYYVSFFTKEEDGSYHRGRPRCFFFRRDGGCVRKGKKANEEKKRGKKKGLESVDDSRGRKKSEEDTGMMVMMMNRRRRRKRKRKKRKRKTNLKQNPPKDQKSPEPKKQWKNDLKSYQKHE